MPILWIVSEKNEYKMMHNYDVQIQIPYTGYLMQYWYIVAIECIVAHVIVVEA